tara:strand:+ start:1421 stop:1825 length:405 start_codon:yes stop_codon:yes gene_type:complete
MATWNGTTGYTNDQATQLNKVTDARKTADTPDILDAISMWNNDSFKAKLKTYTAAELKALVNIKSYSAGNSDTTATIVYDTDANDYTTQEQTWIAGFTIKSQWVQKLPQMLASAERLKALSYTDQTIIDTLREY